MSAVAAKLAVARYLAPAIRNVSAAELFQLPLPTLKRLLVGLVHSMKFATCFVPAFD